LLTAGDGLAHLTARRTRASVAGVAWNLLTVGLSSALALSVFLITSRVLTPADFGAVALAAAVRRDGVDAGARGLRRGADPARGPAAGISTACSG
jgi:teichuronic acid exporter